MEDDPELAEDVRAVDALRAEANAREWAAFHRALTASDGNIMRAARLLGIERHRLDSALRVRLRDLAAEFPRRKGGRPAVARDDTSALK